jgi:hypothetical protein
MRSVRELAVDASPVGLGPTSTIGREPPAKAGRLRAAGRPALGGTAVHVHVEGLAGLVSGRTSGATWSIPELSMSTCRAGSQTMSQTARGDAATRRVTETRSGRAVFIIGHLVQRVRREYGCGRRIPRWS